LREYDALKAEIEAIQNECTLLMGRLEPDSKVFQ
jgi:hypothetical protein